MLKVKFILLSIVCAGLLVSCKWFGKKNTDQTPTRGEATVLVDETFYPMVDGQVQVFEYQYKYAKLNVVMMPELDIAAAMRKDTTSVALLSRELNKDELARFESLNITPRVTPIAYDAIALIVNREMKDSSLKVSELKDMLTGKSNPRHWKLVFEDPRSSTVQYMTNFAGVDSLSRDNVFSVKSNKELLEYIASNRNAVGFVGVDWLYESDADHQSYKDKIKVLSMESADGFSKPTQNDIAEGTYPFIRKLNIINSQGTAGLGLGLASFLASDVGQRIILKAGLVPVTLPKREIVIRKNL